MGIQLEKAEVGPASGPTRRLSHCRGFICFVASDGGAWSRGGSAIKYTTRTAHSEALIVRGAGCDVDHLDQPRAGLPFSASSHVSVRNNSYGRVYLWARSVEMGI